MSKGNLEDLNSNLFFRTFYRGTQSNNEADPATKPDVDQIANEEFQAKNFIDSFGLRLRNDLEFRKLNTYNELCSQFWSEQDVNVQTYCVADGQGIPKEEQKEWFRSELRFISIIMPVDAAHSKNPTAPILSVSWAPWFYLIASSSSIHSEQDILHVMSWSASDGQFRYYARDEIQGIPLPVEERAWIYLCNSEDAFDAKGKSYLGPLNGHVNGGLVMKEIHKPWLHWLVGGRGVSELLSKELAEELSSASWLTAPGYPPLYGASMQSGEAFERIVLDSLKLWFDRRQQKDFLNTDGSAKKSPLNIQRWAAHFLLTTNINIIAVPTSVTAIPSDFFFNYEMLRGYGDLLPNSIQNTDQWQKTHPYTGKWLSKFTEDYGNAFGFSYTDADSATWYQEYDLPSFDYDNGTYLWAARELKLCTLQEVPQGTEGAIEFKRDTLAGGVFMGTLQDGKERIDGGEDISFAVTQWGEGQNPWVILQSSIEDAMGVWTAQKMFVGTDSPRTRCRLFSDGVFNALTMVDFWNPIFSWRRLRLMQYIPVDAELIGPEFDPVFDEKVYTYNLEERFVQNIRDAMSHWKFEHNSPEKEFLDNLGDDGKGLPVIAYQTRIWLYATRVSNNLGSSQCVLDYLRLAESRRRMFRPLPQNFFGSNLPYCLGIDPTAPLLEMTEQGFVQQIPEIGLAYLAEWLGGLAGSNPQVIPSEKERSSRIDDGRPPLPRTGLPRAATMRMACQKSIFTTNARIGGSCPFMSRPRNDTSKDAQTTIIDSPTWTDDIQNLFKQPWWPKDKGAGKRWIGAMRGFDGLGLDSYKSVKDNVFVIYRHLRSRSMPLVNSEDEYWPEIALEMLRNWANTGFRETSKDMKTETIVIPKSQEPVQRIRVRKDIMKMTPEEITQYRMKLDDVLHCTERDSKWQELGWLHAQWCLHYQEATFPWHRAMLVYVENLIDYGIPYWNGYATEAGDPSSSFAGIPQVFLDEDYYHPIRKEKRKNPLRYAVNGKEPRTPVRRDPTLEAGRPSSGDTSAWDEKIRKYINLYHVQIKNSLQAKTFSFPQMSGFPWQNLPKFKQDEPDSSYSYRDTFDGLFEQPHDNFHGWLGGDTGDMSDNTWTGFDPLFYSLHANLDRLFDMWLKANPNSTFSSNFPLRPFASMATELRYDDPRRYIYTTIGDMVKDSRTLSYIYSEPASPDFFAFETAASRMLKPISQGGNGLVHPLIGLNATESYITNEERSKKKKIPYIVFDNVQCTNETYRINVYLQKPSGMKNEEEEPALLIAQSTRLGMGQVTSNEKTAQNQNQIQIDSRCDKPSIARAINVEHIADLLRDGEKGKISLEVRSLTTGTDIPKEEYQKWKGFLPRIVWT